MMHSYLCSFAYYYDGEIQYCRLNFADIRASMIFALPRDTSPEGLVAAGRAISGPGVISPLLAAMHPIPEFYLGIPRFRIEFKQDLSVPLKQLGITRAFEPTGDLNGMVKAPSPNLHLLEVLHQSVLDVNEYGVVAVAYTASPLGGGGPKLPIRMTLNRPFACALVDPELDLTFFVALVTDPKESTQPILPDPNRVYLNQFQRKFGT